MSDLTSLSINEMHDGLIKDKFSSEELVKAHLDAIKAKNPGINAFVLVTEDKALELAKEADKRIRKREKISKLTGIPSAIKDIYCTDGVKTTACSKTLENFVPNYESTVTQKLIDAGSVMLGKTNMDEFAMGSANTYSYFGNVKNPLRGKKNEDIVPGGSSGGSAVAVSANLSPFSLGSDTGGSVRQPAAYCGIVGLRPTYGRCSRWGMIAFASSLDQAGIFSRTVEDNATVLEAISGYDNKDSRSAKIDSFKYIKKDIKGLRIGIPKECYFDGLNSEVIQAWEKTAKKLQDLGAQVKEVSLPNIKHSLPVYYIICSAEVSSNLARYDGIRYGTKISASNINIEEMYEQYRATSFGDEVKRRILVGTYVLSSGYYNEYYQQAKRVQNLIMNDYAETFKEVDVLLNPTAPTEAFAINSNPSPLEMYMNDIFTVPTSIARLPCMSVPAGLSSNDLPLGMHLTANYFEENVLYNVAYALEKA